MSSKISTFTFFLIITLVVTYLRIISERGKILIFNNIRVVTIICLLVTHESQCGKIHW